MSMTIAQIRQQVKVGKLRIKEFRVEKEETISSGKSHEQQIAHKTFISEQKFYAQNLSREIELCCGEVSQKCNVELKTISLCQILECQKNMSVLNAEMREIFDKVTSFSKIAALYGGEANTLLENPSNWQEKTLKLKNSFVTKLNHIITERDISEEKLKNASWLKIELPKFKGYESKIDIYSFKTEFEKLIQPTIQKPCWVII